MESFTLWEYIQRLVGFVVDEAHCVLKWYESCIIFRPSIKLLKPIIQGEVFDKFSHVNEIQSIIPEQVKVMALTATATTNITKSIIKH